MSAWEIMDDDAAPLRHVGRPDQLRARRPGLRLAVREHAFPRRLRHGRQEVPLQPDWQRFGGRWQEMPVLPDHFDVIDNATAEKPFRLVAAPARTFLNSTFTETPSSLKREQRPTALMHPEDCAALGVAEGDRVQLGNERGEVIVHVKPQDGQQRGVVVVEGIWPNQPSRTASASTPDQRRSRLAERRRGVPRHRGLDAPAGLMR